MIYRKEKKSASLRASHLITSLLALLTMLIALSACTDYEGVVDDKYEDWLTKVVEVSSSGGTDEDSNSSTSPVVKEYIKDSRDGKLYRIVTIGSQTWMAENLNYDYNVGTAKSWCGGGAGSQAGDCSVYGRLYTWSAAMDSAAVFSDAGKGCGWGGECSPDGTIRGACPEGWHLPSNDEWQTLFDAVGGTDVAGTKLKSNSGWSNSGNGTDSFGFAVLPAGTRSSNGVFDYVGYNAYFWSSTETNGNLAFSWAFSYYRVYVDYYDLNKDSGLSVRCLKDL